MFNKGPKIIGDFYEGFHNASHPDNQPAKERPAHPAIPEEVRETITGGLNMAERDADIEHDPNWQADIKAARDWLAKCGAATDAPLDPEYLSRRDGVEVDRLGREMLHTPSTGAIEQLRQEILNRHERPQASDKAVCPKCGDVLVVDTNDDHVWEGRCLGQCNIEGRKDRVYHVRFVVISPPREPKVTP